jgi:hypothetical protein
MPSLCRARAGLEIRAHVCFEHIPRKQHRPGN